MATDAAYYERDGKVAVNRRALAEILMRVDPEGHLQATYDLGTAWVDDGSGFARSLVEASRG